MNIRKPASLLLAAAVATAFATVSLTATAGGAKHQVKCMGVNACKGKAQCKTSMNACKGQNACKGKGYMMMSAKACKAKGGTVMK